MTEDRGKVTAVAAGTDSEAPQLTPEPGADSTARNHLIVAALFLPTAMLLYLLAAVKLVWPDFIDGIAFLSYGRVLPMGINSLLFGWLTLALIGAMYYIVPRVAGTSLWGGRLAGVNLLVAVIAYGTGIAAVGLGDNQGRRYLEMPGWVDVVVVVTLLVAAMIVTRTARAGREESLPAPLWFLVAASWWVVLAYAVGSLPGIGGVAAAIQGWFAVAGLTGLWFAAAGIGLGYFLIPRLVEGAVFNPRLSVIGFWSLAFAWAWTGARYLMYGPSQDFLETISIVFSAGVLIAVVTVLADFGIALGGRWQTVAGSVPLKFYVAGAALFALVPVHHLIQGLRSSSAVVHFTPWETAYEQLAFFGAFTLWVLAFVYFAIPRITGRSWSDRLAGWHLWLTLLGLGVSLFSRWVAGIQLGYTWVGGVNSRAYANTGEGFLNSVQPLEGYELLQVVGLGLVALAQLLFLFHLLWTLVAGPRRSPEPPREVAPDDGARYPLRTIVRGAVALFVLAALGAFVVPALDADDEGPTLLAEESRRLEAGSDEAAGRDVYIQEGCWYCHTQQVRPVITDVGLGPVGRIGDYVFDEPPLLGLERIGPDLAHSGSRSPTDSLRWNLEHLKAPRTSEDPEVRRPWSTMPAYDYLSDEELVAVATYVTSLR
ncbi:MAG: cbb3-type cytochrome c oxidase subunit I [Acidimicrobiia bacterium]